MPANPWRGEMELLLGDVSYILRPSFEALCNIETELNMGLIVLARKLAAQAITPYELSTIIWHCLKKETPVERVYLQKALTYEYSLQVAANLFTSIFEGFSYGG
jgi:hypothetical protein